MLAATPPGQHDQEHSDLEEAFLHHILPLLRPTIEIGIRILVVGIRIAIAIGIAIVVVGIVVGIGMQPTHHPSGPGHSQLQLPRQHFVQALPELFPNTNKANGTPSTRTNE